jgi:ketosteroid isomerase-like protein
MRLTPVSWSWLSRLALFAALSYPAVAYAQDIPLEHCDTLPMVKTEIAGNPAWFLVDTAATSMLNLESFAHGASKDLSVTSWSGTVTTTAKEVTLRELVVGRTTLARITLPAVNISALGKACGRKIDGILGVDLLGKIGASIDLQRQVLHVRTIEDQRAAEVAAEMQRDTERCMKAFNSSDEAAFKDCLDPHIVLSTPKEELYGREEVARHFRNGYFHQKPAAHLDIQETDFHATGEAVWYEYEFTIDLAHGRIHGRGIGMCKKSEGRWRMASMHHSLMEYEAALSSSIRGHD